MGREAGIIARQLSKAQRRYLLAVGDAESPYAPRHGRTANWALRHNYAYTIFRLKDGREEAWGSLSMQDRLDIGLDDFLGQRLTVFGRQIYSFLLRSPDA